MPQLKPTRGILLNKSHPLARNVVAYCLNDEGTGKSHMSIRGKMFELTEGGTPLWKSGRFGWSREFDDGSSEYLEINKAVISGPPFTIVAWIRPDDLGQVGYVLSISDKDLTYRWCGVVANYPSNGDISAVSYNGASLGVATAAKAMSLNTWHQVCGVWHSASDRRAYVDGGNEGIETTTSAPPGLDRTSVGRCGDATPAYYLSGKVDIVIVWGRALSVAELAWLHREPFCMFGKAIRPGLIGSQIINFAGTSAALSSLSATAKAIQKVVGTVASTSDVAALLNLIRGEETSLEIERSWLREALFNGMTANAFKLGTTLSLGWFWVRVAGCSVLYRGPGMERIDFTNILTVAEQNACEISPPSYVPHNSSSTYFYVIRRFNTCGYQELTLAAAAKVLIDGGGELGKPEPNNIFSSKAEQVDGDKIQLVWFYCPLEQKSQPVCFNVYYDGGTGQIDHENPLAKIGYEGQRFYRYQSGALDAGGYLFTIRAEDVDGIENSSSAQLRIQLDTTNPDAIDILSTETV